MSRFFLSEIFCPLCAFVKIITVNSLFCCSRFGLTLIKLYRTDTADVKVGLTSIYNLSPGDFRNPRGWLSLVSFALRILIHCLYYRYSLLTIGCQVFVAANDRHLQSRNSQVLSNL